MPRVSQSGHAIHSHACMPTHMLPHPHTQGPVFMFVRRWRYSPWIFLFQTRLYILAPSSLTRATQFLSSSPLSERLYWNKSAGEILRSKFKAFPRLCDV